MTVALYIAIALASVIVPALLVYLSVAISDALEARHNARSSGPDEDDRAVNLAEFVRVHTETINSAEGYYLVPRR